MTAPKPTEETAPTVFGRPMLPAMSSWLLYLPGFRCQIDTHGMYWWSTFVEVKGVRFDAGDGLVSLDEAARAIEARIAELVMTLAPLLPDDAKRELVEAARIGLEHFPSCPDEGRENETEPLL